MPSWLMAISRTRRSPSSRSTSTTEARMRRVPKARLTASKVHTGRMSAVGWLRGVCPGSICDTGGSRLSFVKKSTMSRVPIRKSGIAPTLSAVSEIR